jgi:hypothetical protein
MVSWVLLVRTCYSLFWHRFVDLQHARGMLTSSWAPHHSCQPLLYEHILSWFVCKLMLAALYYVTM